MVVFAGFESARRSWVHCIASLFVQGARSRGECLEKEINLQFHRLMFGLEGETANVAQALG